MIKAICFDMDGLLLDTERLGSQVLYEAAALQGCYMADDQWKSLIGLNMETTKRVMNEWFPGKINADRYIADWCRLMMEHVRRDGLPYMPYARETLATLKEHGLGLALCTSNDPEVVAEYLRLAGWDTLFDHVITGDMVANGKPAPDIYLLGAKKLGVSPAECAGVEDSVNGVKAVRAAGMLSIMIPDVLPYTANLAPYVDKCLSSLQELEQAIMQ